MGLEILEENAPAWKRKWDRGRSELQSPNLFTAENRKIDSVIRFQVQAEALPELGQKLLLSGTPIGAKVSDGVQEIGESSSIPETIAEALKTGRVATVTVKKVFRRSRTIEILVR